MNNRLCHGKVVVFTTFYQFFSTYVNEFRISLCPTTLHWRQENVCWAKHDIFIDTALQQSCVSSATAALLSCFNVSALGVRGTLEVLPPQRSPIAEHAHGSCFCHYILALWSLSPFSGDFFFFWTQMCQLYYFALKGCWMWDMCDDMMVPWQQAVISSVPDGEFFQAHIRKNSCVVL